MKKSQFNLLKLAHKFENKYAQGQSLKDAVSNAASWYSKNPANGIMDFPAQLTTDKATMTLIVNNNNGTYTVSEPALIPANVAGNYAGLSGQIKKYLERNFAKSFADDLKWEFKGVAPEVAPEIAQQ